MRSPGSPTSTTQVGRAASACSGGRGNTPLRHTPTDVTGSASGPTKPSSNRGGWPMPRNTLLAERSTSAGPAQSSVRLCGSSTNSTRMAGGVAAFMRAFIFPKWACLRG